MKLILSLTLIWMISYTAEALQCYRRGQNIEHPVLQTCGSADHLCATVAAQGLNSTMTMLCVPPYFCAAPSQLLSFSDIDYTLTASVHCCKTDGCNNQDIPYPDPGKKNGLRCSTCSRFSAGELICNSTVECVGVQDRCIDVHVENQDTIYLILGCVSANVCELLSQQKVRSDITSYFNITITPRVQGASFCNSACIVNANVVSLLLGFFALFLPRV